jgi:hypothetical protein
MSQAMHGIRQFRQNSNTAAIVAVEEEEDSVSE